MRHNGHIPKTDTSTQVGTDSRKLDPLRDGYIVAASVWLIAIAVGMLPVPVDAAQFYAHRLPNPYDVADYGSGVGFYYSPVAAVAMYPFMALGPHVFGATLTGAGFVALYALLGRWAVFGLFFPPVWWDLSSGNINIVLGAVFVLGLRWQGLWAVALFTKVTPAIGIVWFAVRREWRSLALVLGLSAGLVLGTLPTGLWPQWIASLTASSGASAGPGYFTIEVPLLPRLALALPLVAFAAWRGSVRWLIVACTLAMPVLWYTALAPLIGLVRHSGTYTAAHSHKQPMTNAASRMTAESFHTGRLSAIVVRTVDAIRR